VRNSAATTALLNAPNDPSQVIPTYDAITNEHAQIGYSPTQNQILSSRKTQEASSFQQAMYETLASGEVPDVTKMDVIAYHQSGALAKSNLLTAQGMLGTQEAGETNLNETAEATITRDLFAAGMDKAIEYKRQQQAIYNATAMAQEKAGLTATVTGMVEDMVPGVSSSKASSLYNSLTDDTRGTIASFFLQGTSKAVMAEKFNALPLDQRMSLMDGIAQRINEEGRTILLPSEKDNANLQSLIEVTRSGSYTATDEVIDNLSGLLDMSGLAVPFRAAARFLSGGKKIAEAGKALDAVEMATDAERSIQRRQLTAQQQPSAPMEILKDANPEKARRVIQAVDGDATDEFAQAMTGTGRDNALAGYTAPQPPSLDGSVQSKVFDPTRYADFDYMPDNDTLDLVRSASAPNLSTVEKRRLDANVTNDFRNATGLVNRGEMTTVGVDEAGTGLDIAAVYGPSDTGWSSVKDAVEQAQYALRKYAIDEDNIEVLVRDGDSYRGIAYSALKDAEGDVGGDYLLRVKQKYQYNAGDLADDEFDFFNVNPIANVLNRANIGIGSSGRGSVTSNFVAPEALFSPEYMKTAVLSDLKKDVISEKLTEVAQSFTKQIKGMPAERRNKIVDTIKEFNSKGISYNYTDLAGRGFNADEIKAFEAFKKAQDTMWHLTNADMVRSYKTRGFGRISYKETGLDVVARPLSQQAVKNNVAVYDAMTDTVRTLSKEEKASLYSRNANVAELAHPLEVDGVNVMHVINENSANGTYIRALSDDDTVMAYRKGYYAVKYTQPHFIERKLVDADGVAVLDENGQEVWKAMATAPDMLSANKSIERYKKARPSDYRVRADLKGADYDKANTQVMSAGGLSAQRFRGQRLEDAIGSNTELDGAHLQSPIESMISSIESVSSRISYRDWLETSKKRLLATYSDVMPLKSGKPVYPSNVSEITGNSRKAADARAMFEHIRAMENGYVHALDDGAKAIMGQVADALGFASVKAGDNLLGKGIAGAERGVRVAATTSYSGLLRATSFITMIALNPLRQLAVQFAQASMLLGRHPTYLPHLFGDAALLMIDKMLPNAPKEVYRLFGRDKEAFKTMKAAMESSGVTKGIKRHEMLQGMMAANTDLSLMYRSRASQAARKTAGGVVNTARRIGFDTGEYFVQATSFFSHYDDAMKAGAKLSKEQIRDVANASRQFTGNFSRSGQMALNHNELNIIGQYGQVPLKMIGLLFNRSIPVKARAGMGLFAVGMFGTPDMVSSLFADSLPEDATERELIVGGLSNALTNAMIEAVFGQKSQVDWGGGMNPYDPQGVMEMIVSAFSQPIGETIANSPVGSLFFGSNPRISNLIRSFGYASGLVTDPSPDTSVEKWHTVMMDVLNLSSGASNARKAWLMLKYQREYSATGATTRDNVTTPEAFAKLLGFQSLEQARSFAVMDDITAEHDKYYEDIKQYFNDVSRRMVAEGITAEQQDYLVRMSQYGMSAFPNNAEAHKYWMALMTQQIKGGDRRLFDAIMNASGWASREDVISWINKATLSPDDRATLLSVAKWSFSEEEVKSINKLNQQ